MQRLIGLGKNFITNYWFEILLFTSSFILRFYIYNKSPFANGWDSYFYIVQIKSYLEEGAMHSSRSSIFYPLLLFFKFLIVDYESTYKITSAFIVACFSLAFFRTAWYLSKKSNVAYIMGAYTLLSFQLTYFGAQYPKNLLGVVLFL